MLPGPAVRRTFKHSANVVPKNVCFDLSKKKGEMCRGQPMAVSGKYTHVHHFSFFECNLIGRRVRGWPDSPCQTATGRVAGDDGGGCTFV